MNIVFFRRPKPRQFNYKPIYYDPAKEEAEERKKNPGLQQGDEHRERFRATMRRSWKGDQPPGGNRISATRIFVYAFIAVLSIYFIFFTDFLTRFVSLFLR